MTTDAAIMADLNFAGIDKANPRATTKTMLPVNAQRDESRGLFDKTLIARQLRELLSPVDTNMIGSSLPFMLNQHTRCQDNILLTQKFRKFLKP